MATSGHAATSRADALFGGELRLLQPIRGYRINVDTLILAGFAAECRPSARRVIDLGSGVGGLSLAFGRLGSARTFDLVEQDVPLAALAERNLTSAGLSGGVHVSNLESTGLPKTLYGVANVVLSNPPFFARSTRESNDEQRRLARSGPLEPFLRAATLAMGPRAYAFFAYPADALPEFLAKARAAGLVAKRLRFVQAYANSVARLALIELRKAKPGGLVIEPAWIEWSARGVRSPTLEALVNGRLPSAPPAAAAAGALSSHPARDRE
jgi:tRNA1(Val) A37 N6-methylase TrmN6